MTRLDDQQRQEQTGTKPRWSPLEIQDDDDNDNVPDNKMNQSGAPPVDPHAADLGGSLTSAVLGIVKGMVGPAILYLPHGLAAAGYLVALPLMALTTAMYLHSSRCLLDAWRLEHDRRLKGGEYAPVSDKSERDPDEERVSLASKGSTAVAAAAAADTNGGVSKRDPRRDHLSYPELALCAYGPRAQTAVQVGIAAMQSGVVLTYLIFVPRNLHASCQQLLGEFGKTISSPGLWLLVMIAIEIPLSWIRDIRKFVTTNGIANGLILYGLTLCLLFAFTKSISQLDDTSDAAESTGDDAAAAAAVPKSSSSGPITNFWDHVGQLDAFASNWFLFIGTSVLLFEGSITLLIPLQEAVETAEDRKYFPTMYRQVILSIVGFYVVFGLTCWIAFGNKVETVLTTSLPSGFMATTVQLAYSVAVILTFPLQNYPALQITCKAIAKHLTTMTTVQGSNTFMGAIAGWLLASAEAGGGGLYNTIATACVCAMALVAVTTMNSLDKVVSLMGSLLGCPIAFCFPPLILNRLDENLPARRRGTNYLVAGLGFVAMVYASIITIWQW